MCTTQRESMWTALVIWIVLPFLLIVALPCIICGCSPLLCPLYDINIATTVSSDYTQNTCNCCFQSNIDGVCFKSGPCECGTQFTKFNYNGGSCALNTDKAYQIGEQVTIFIYKSSKECTLPTTLLANTVYVGITFVALSLLDFCIAIGATVACCCVIAD